MNPFVIDREFIRSSLESWSKELGICLFRGIVE